MKKQFIRNRKVRYAGITVVLTVLVVAVTVLANAAFSTLAKRYQWYTSMLPVQRFDVTEDCFALLEEIFESEQDAKVEIIFCDKPSNIAEDVTLTYVYNTARTLEARFPENLTITCHDIWTNPNTVRQYTTTLDPVTGETYEVALKSTSVILVSENYHRVYQMTEFFTFKGGNTANLWAYNGEKKLASGILRAVDLNAPVACLTRNHGEIFYDYELLYLLDDAGYSVKYIDLYNEEIPKGCDLLISYNPNTDLIDDEVSAVSEVDILNDFLAEDGNTFLVLLEDGTPKLPNFEAYLSDWGVAFNYYTDVSTGNSYRYMVQDSSQSLTSDGYTIYGEAVREGGSDQILQGLDRKVVFKNATAMTAAQGFVNNGNGSYTSGNRTLYSLYESGANAVSWANGVPVSGESAILMTLTEQKTEQASSYVGVIASVDFSSEEFLQSAVYGNTDSMLRLFRTVGKEITPEGLTVQPFASRDISTITTAQMLRWTIGLALTPAIVITAIAVFVLVKRRRA